MFDFWRKKFDDILIDRAIKDSVTARRFLNIFPDKTRIVDGEPEDMKKGSLTASEFSRSKRQIFVTRFKGRFFKKCPGFHKGMACCNYFVLNLGFQCDMDCSYCYLQSFINSSHLTVYSNIEEALAELKSMNHLKDQPLRIGTGEVMDSLSLDPITLHSRQLIDFFKITRSGNLNLKQNQPSWTSFWIVTTREILSVAGPSIPPLLLKVKSREQPLSMNAWKRLKNAWPEAFRWLFILIP